MLNEKLLILQELDRIVVDAICNKEEEDITELLNSEVESHSEYEEKIFATLHKIEKLEKMEPKIGEISDIKVSQDPQLNASGISNAPDLQDFVFVVVHMDLSYLS